MTESFIIQTRHPIRRLYEPLGIARRAHFAARELGWDGKTNMVYLDSDGLPLGGFVPK